jgi:hypothetical protein
MTPSVLLTDNLDDRREIFHLLHRLPPRFRVLFVEWCCCQIEGTRPTVNGLAMRETLHAARKCDVANERLTTMCYADMMVLGHQWCLDFGKATLELEQWVKRPESRMVPRRVRK